MNNPPIIKGGCRVRASGSKKASVRVTENQLKVIRDKYLRDAPGVEAWLEGVARNVALAELAFHPDAERWGLFAGVRHQALGATGPDGLPPSRMLLLQEGLEAHEREANFTR